ncbi:hypothetical protein F5Y11DRAFT_336891 [Daldinia sp. FL1419]|nr:hypothetical protein F5Y11DRAFT_336891 [Daldinia sp. FL1419]
MRRPICDWAVLAFMSLGRFCFVLWLRPWLEFGVEVAFSNPAPRHSVKKTPRNPTGIYHFHHPSSIIAFHF